MGWDTYTCLSTQHFIRCLALHLNVIIPPFAVTTELIGELTMCPHRLGFPYHSFLPHILHHEVPHCESGRVGGGVKMLQI